MKVHVRYDGRSRNLDLPAELLEMTPDWRSALLDRLVSQGYLPKGPLSVVVDQHPEGFVVVRPPATWG